MIPKFLIGSDGARISVQEAAKAKLKEKINMKIINKY